MGRRWSQDDIAYLKDNYGALSLKTLCLHLGRSEISIRLMADRLQLGRWYHNLESITVNELAKALSVDYNTIKNWGNNYGLPWKEKRFDEFYIKTIKIEDFWSWAETNRNMIEWDKFEKYLLGSEPAWVDEARKAKVLEKDRSMKKKSWSKSEDEKLLWMLNQHRFTYPQISAELGRTHGAIKRRMHDLGIKLRPIYLDNKRKYSQEEIDTILSMYQKGYCFKVIAAKLNRSEAGVRGKVERMGYTFDNRVLKKPEEVMSK